MNRLMTLAAIAVLVGGCGDGNKANEEPSLTEKEKSALKVSNAQANKIVKEPMYVRLKSNNKADVIVKVVRESGHDATHKFYAIEWTPEGAI